MNTRLALRAALAAGVFLVALALLPTLAVEVASWGRELPAELDPNRESSVRATRVRDRGGVLLAELRVDGKHFLPVQFEQLPEHVVQALLAAEDKRFFSHRGVDWWAVGRALTQWVKAGRVVSGASTLTQQLARSTFARERSLWGKWQEMVLARCIERHLTKPQILEAYVNRVEFGPNVVGIAAASEVYFAKPVAGLSLSEAATLTGIPRGPALYDPKRPRSPIQRRRDRILERLAENEPRYTPQVQQALSMPLELQEHWVAPGAFHWVRRLAGVGADGRGGSPQAEVRTTLDSSLQRRVEALVLRHVDTMTKFGASSAAVLVADNRTHEVLAYVGSPDYRATSAAGQNDGVVALRQPGSTLKPFVYAAAMERLGYTAATLLPDVALEFREAGKVFSPRNYDGQFHGPVRLREALANSLNIPAVYTASQLGVGQLLASLHGLGFASLTNTPEHYGVALALGDGEVTLEELVSAYMVLPNGGVLHALNLVQDQVNTAPKAVMRPTIAALVRDMLEDPLARAASFGRNNVLEFGFPVGVKTGTSKGARDNWTLGFSEAVTVGVWVGNFDGTPMTGASGVSGAGPLFHAVMQEATAWVTARHPAAAPAQPPALTRLSVCALSGKLPTEHCKARVTELFITGTEPTVVDDMHVAVPVLNGAVAPGCPGATTQVYELYPTQFEAWAREAGRPVVPTQTLSNCETLVVNATSDEPRVLFPRNGAEYRWVADEPAARQQLVFEGKSGAGPLTFLLDGVAYRRVDAPYRVEWPLARGEHSLQVTAADGRRSEVVHFRVK